MRNRKRTSLIENLLFLTGEGVMSTLHFSLLPFSVISSLVLFSTGDERWVSLVSAAMTFGSFLSLSLPYLAAIIPSRKKLFLTATGFGKFSLFLLIPPLLKSGRLSPLVIVPIFLLYSFGNAVGGGVWTAWFSKLVPGKIRGRFFAVRSTLMAVFGLAFSGAGVKILDVFRSREEVGFAVLLGVSGAAAAAQLLVISYLKDSRSHNPQPPVRSFRVALSDPSYRAFLSFVFLFTAAKAVCGPFLYPYFLQQGGLSYSQLALYDLISNGSGFAFIYLWGKLIDRYGGKFVLKLSSSAFVLVVPIWYFVWKGFTLFVWVDGVVNGVFFQGYALSYTTENLKLVGSLSRRVRDFAAVLSVAGVNIFSTLGTLAGTGVYSLAKLYFPHPVPYYIIFALSFVLRATVFLFFARS